MKSPHRRRLASLLAREEGFTLVELVAALGIGAIVMMAVFAGMTGGVAGIESGRNQTRATAEARAAMEEARAIGWEDLSLVTGAVAADPNVTPCSGLYCYNGEQVVESATGLLTPYKTQQTFGGLTYTISTYVTWAVLSPPSSAKRISALVTWTERGRARRVTASSLMHPVAANVGSAARVLKGVVAGSSFGDVGYVEAPAEGGSQSATVATFDPAPGVSGTAGTAAATVTAAGPTGYATSSASTMNIGLSGLSISASSVSVEATSSVGSIGVTGQGTVNVNGVPYVNPAPGTIVTVPGWHVILNDQRREADGSMSITYIRIISLLTNEEIQAVWAWVRPAVYLGP